MDKAAVGFDYKSQAEKHDSQKGELGEPSASGMSVLELGNVLLGLCLVFATCCMNGLGQVRKAITWGMTAGKSSS